VPLAAAEAVVKGDWSAWIVLFAPLAAAAIVLCVPFVRRRGGLAATLSIGAIAAGLAITLVKFFVPAVTGHHSVVEDVVPWLDVGPVFVEFGTRVDALATTMMLVVTGVGLAIHVYSLGYMKGDPGMGRFFGKLSLFVFSMLGIVVSPNFVQTFVFWELVGVSSYLLIGYYWQKDSAGEAAKKAFMTNRVGDFGFLLGILVVWSAAGGWRLGGGQTFDFDALRSMLTGGGTHAPDVGALGAFAALGGALVFCGAMGKSAQFPLHVWLPDAMEGPTPVSALMHAATMVAAGVYMIIRCFFLFEGVTWAPTLVAWLGGITALMAATMAVTQRDIKKILAYSTLSQLGYMTLALGAGAYTGAMFHLTTHAFFKALLFLAAGSVIHACHTQDIFEMGGLRKFMPSTWRTFLIGTLALCGIFPFAGFWSKDEILSAVLHADGLPGHVVLWVLGTAVAGLTSFYMGRCLVVTFLGEHRGAPASAHGHGHGHAAAHDDHGGHATPHESPPVMTWPLWFLALGSVLVGFVGVPSDFPGGLFHNRFEHFLEAWSLEEGSFHVSVALVSTVVAVLGLVLAFRVYRRAAPGHDPLPEKLGFVWTLWNRLYFVDDLYLWLVRRVQQGIAWVCWLFERRVIIGALVNGTSQGARLAGDRLRRVQGGRLTSYVTWIVLGTVALAVAALWR
jgi:NADH-quinone oxidoreductase subunit L